VSLRLQIAQHSLTYIKDVQLVVLYDDPTALLQPSITIFRASYYSSREPLLNFASRTVSRKNFQSTKTFIDEPDSRAQVVALEDNTKEFGITYFGMTDRRQGMATPH
jgi:hypothetical protein